MKKYFATIVFLLFVFPLMAQSGGIPTSEGISNTWLMNDVENNKALSGNYSSVAGNPYLNRTFQEGELVSNNKVKFSKALMRYNVYTDNIEYKAPNNKVYTLKYPGPGEAYIIGDTVFVYSPYYQRSKKIAMSYFQVLEGGKAALGLMRYSVYIQPYQQAKPFTPAQPPRFSGKITSYYVKLGDAPAKEILSKKSFLELFPKQKNQLARFIKKGHLSIKKPSDFAKIIRYYNDLVTKK